ncbi:MAG: SH3 domain-containing protein [Coleofasciculaceae cyanobacterium SM2_1_6]|nr:SH3 domain-containing protein [Coleofasciculaceae cyanobacterium SM2_1_6]
MQCSNTSRYRNFLFGLGVAVVSMVGNFVPVFAATTNASLETLPVDSPLLAQAAPDRCRRSVVPEGLNIRAQPSLTAAVIGLVGYLQTVNLSTLPATVNTVGGINWVQITLSNGATGWIANGAPGTGGNVLPCTTVVNPPTTTPPVTPGGTCRLVRSPIGGGLAIRATPGGNLVGGVANGQTVTLANPPVTRVEGGRQWLQITAPVSGWVSNGQPGSSGNLGNCP